MWSLWNLRFNDKNGIEFDIPWKMTWNLEFHIIYNLKFHAKFYLLYQVR